MKAYLWYVQIIFCVYLSLKNRYFILIILKTKIATHVINTNSSRIMGVCSNTLLEPTVTVILIFVERMTYYIIYVHSKFTTRAFIRLQVYGRSISAPNFNAWGIRNMMFLSNCPFHLFFEGTGACFYVRSLIAKGWCMKVKIFEFFLLSQIIFDCTTIYYRFFFQGLLPNNFCYVYGRSCAVVNFP